MGQPNAKVRVEAFYPLDDEHKWVVTTLRDAAQSYGEKVLIRAFDIGTDWGRREWEKRGLQCGGVLINDKSCFTVDAKKVAFLRDPGDSTWTENQLRAVIAHEVDNAYRPAEAEPGPPRQKDQRRFPTWPAAGQACSCSVAPGCESQSKRCVQLSRSSQACR
jgi:hypothetical protein